MQKNWLKTLLKNSYTVRNIQGGPEK